MSLNPIALAAGAAFGRIKHGHRTGRWLAGAGLMHYAGRNAAHAPHGKAVTVRLR
jgi:hypothetical protein